MASIKPSRRVTVNVFVDGDLANVTTISGAEHGLPRGDGIGVDWSAMYEAMR